MAAEIIKLKVTSQLLRHCYLNGFGRTERECELNREWRRLMNAIAVLKKRERVVLRAIDMDVNRSRRSLEDFT